MSHPSLPPAERKLHIESYLSSMPKGTLSKLWRGVSGQSSDPYLDQMPVSKAAPVVRVRDAHRPVITKEAANRSVKEWRSMQAAGDSGGADQLAKAYGGLGNKPRYLKDISLGGSEAGVDQMMGRVSNPNTGAVNDSGYLARKMYKPDSDITRGEHTNQMLHQKQQITNEARAMSPEAKSIVPDMYGHKTMGTGGLQRTTSDHEYVHGLSDIRGERTYSTGGRRLNDEATRKMDKIVNSKWSRAPSERAADLAHVQDNVLKPMEARGKMLADTVGDRGTNYGNVMNSPTGPKVMDFLPVVEGQKDHITDSYKKYAPTGKSRFEELPNQTNAQQRGLQGELRKEVYRPKQQIAEASPKMQMQAAAHLRGEAPAPGTPMPPAAVSASARTAPPTGGQPWGTPRPTPSTVHAPTSATVRPGLRPAVGTAATAPRALSGIHAPNLSSRSQWLAAERPWAALAAADLKGVISKPTSILGNAANRLGKAVGHVR